MPEGLRWYKMRITWEDGSEKVYRFKTPEDVFLAQSFCDYFGHSYGKVIEHRGKRWKKFTFYTVADFIDWDQNPAEEAWAASNGVT